MEGKEVAESKITDEVKEYDVENNVQNDVNGEEGPQMAVEEDVPTVNNPEAGELDKREIQGSTPDDQSRDWPTEEDSSAKPGESNEKEVEEPKTTDNDGLDNSGPEEMESNHAKDEKVPQVSDSPDGETTQPKNYKSVILEDWDLEAPPGSVAEIQRSTENSDNTNNNNNNNNNNNVDSDKVNAYGNGSCENNLEKEIGVSEKDNEVVKTEVDECRVNAAEESNGVNALKAEIVDKKGDDADKDLIKTVLDKKKNPLKYANLIFSNQDLVDILDNSVERVCRPIIPAKDIFLSIELTKHLNQKLNTSTPAKNAAMDSPVTKTPVNSNELGIKLSPESQSSVLQSPGQQAEAELKSLDHSSTAEATPPGKSSPADDPNKKGKKKFVKKNIYLGEEMVRKIALRQLRDEFPSPRKRTHKAKKVNHIPFLASSVLEKALTAANTPTKASGQRRRPCYLPDDAATDSEVKKKKLEENNENEVLADADKTENSQGLNSSDNSNSSVPVVRTYCIKRKSTESENDVRSALQTFISVSKEYQEGDEEAELKPKKQKTAQPGANADSRKVAKSASKKGKIDAGANRRRNLELEKLLGDEGAVRMLYDTQHKDDNSRLSGKKSRTKTTQGLKKDLMMKTKLVKNAVLRLSGTSSDGVSLRGKRGSRSMKSEVETASESDSLFATSTPNVILYKPKQKQRAEASRILYRHSSSESFESLEGGFRRPSFEGDTINSTNNEVSNLVNGDLFAEKETVEPEESDNLSGSGKKSKSARKTKTLGGKKVKSQKESPVSVDAEREGVDSSNANNSRLVWSNVPVRKSSRPRMVSKKYSIWASTSMDSLSVESLGLKKPKKASQEFAKKLNYKELRILQHESLVQIILAPSSTVLKNSFNEQVLTELKEALDFLAQQESCSAVLLTSSGTAFCQGIDLNYVLSVEEEDRKQTFENLLTCLKKLILCMANYTKPVIAAVHAGAIGLGVTLLPYCDIIVCSDRASFYTPYARLGQVSEGAPTATFPRINRNLVTELLLKSEKITATEAMKLGLVSQVIPEDRFEEEVMLLSRRIASQSVQAMQSMKTLMNRNEYDRIVETLEVESQLVLEHWCSNECINNIIKFLNSGEVQFRQLDVT